MWFFSKIWSFFWRIWRWIWFVFWKIWVWIWSIYSKIISSVKHWWTQEDESLRPSVFSKSVSQDKQINTWITWIQEEQQTVIEEEEKVNEWEWFMYHEDKKEDKKEEIQEENIEELENTEKETQEEYEYESFIWDEDSHTTEADLWMNVEENIEDQFNEFREKFDLKESEEWNKFELILNRHSIIVLKNWEKYIEKNWNYLFDDQIIKDVLWSLQDDNINLEQLDWIEELLRRLDNFQKW